MPRYSVRLRRTTVEYAYVEVDAPDEERAGYAAEAAAGVADWEVLDERARDMEVTDVEEVEDE